MIFRYLFLFLMVFSGIGLSAQKAENVLKSDRENQISSLRACDNDAGTITLGNFIGQSDRHDIEDTIFLCWQDRFFIEHNGDYNLSGDPVPSTAPGIGYAWYDGIPTVPGPDLLSIEADPQAYKPSGEVVVYVDQLNGDAMFENSYYVGFTTFNEFISGGSITQKYFAPITFDQRFGSQALYEGSPAGECVNARVDEAFTVVYLNPIEANNIITQYLGDPDRVRFSISGGMPEFNGSEYTDVTIQLKSKPSVKATISGSGFSHGDNVEFTVPEYGLYQIIVRDGISCEKIVEVNVQEYSIPTFILDTLTGNFGDIVCLTWTVENFEEIQFIFGGIKFNPAVVQYSGSTAFNDHDVVIGSVIGPDQVSVQWSAKDAGYYTLDDGEIIAEICFEIVGEPGDCTPIYFNNTDAVYTDAFGSGDVTPNQEPGLICVDPPSGLYVQTDYCGGVSGADNGSFTFQIFNGTGPYTYVFQTVSDIIESGSNVPENAGRITIFNLLPGVNYEIVVTDALGATFNKTVYIPIVDNPLTIDFVNVNQPSCFGDADGSIGIEVSGGTVVNPGDYTVQWSTNDFAVTNLLQLGNGTYCVTITEDFTGCETDACINIGVDPLDVQLVVLDTSLCIDSGGGSVEALVSGGTPEVTGYNFEWKWNDENEITADQGYSSIYQDLSPGIVYVEVWDSFRYCKYVDSIEMPYLYDLQIDANISDPLCYNENNGSVGLLASLGNNVGSSFSFFPIPPYTPDPQNFTVIGQDSLFADNLTEGYYRIEVTEINSGCRTIAEFFLNNPTEMVTSVSTENLGCQDGQLGSATVMARGGTDPYTITSISGLPDADIAFSTGTHTYNDLDTGTYYITIVDSVGCTMQDTFEILGNEGELYIDSLVYEPFECVPGATTDITAFATSTATGIFYLWMDEDGDVIDVDNVLDNAKSGKYYIQISDSNECELIDSIELFEPELFTLDIILTEPECFGANGGLPGSICVNPVGGTPGFNYTWDDGTPPDQSCLENISEGTYTLQVSDVNNCRVDTTLVLDGPSEIDVDIISLSGISCNDGQTFDGEIIVTASGGNNPTNSYSYQLSSGTGGFGDIHTANNLEGGENWVLVSFNTLSGNVCYADTSYFEIEIPEVLEMDFSQVFIQDASCFGDCDGIAIIGATGGNNSFYGYNWLETGDSGAAVSTLCAGTYNIEITDANGCTVIDSIIINQPDPLVVYTDPDNTFGVNCFGPNTGQIQVIHEGGNAGGAFTYEWTNTDAIGPLASELAEGDYSVTVTDSKGCSASIDITLDAQEPVLAVVQDPEPIKCYGEQTCITIESATGGSGNYTFSVNNGPRYSLDSCINVYGSEQEYLIQVFDQAGCPFSTNILIEQPDPVIVNLGDDIEIGLGELTIINASILSDNPIVLIEWTPMGPDDICLGANCEKLEIHPDENTTYSVIVKDINGCVGEDDVNVIINSKRNVYIPNIFSPNGDEFNERFEIYTGNGIGRINFFRIFDRWGELVYNAEKLAPNPTGVGDWDGTYRGSKLMPGVYVYLIEVEFIDGRVIIYRGSVTLLR